MKMPGKVGLCMMGMAAAGMTGYYLGLPEDKKQDLKKKLGSVTEAASSMTDIMK